MYFDFLDGKRNGKKRRLHNFCKFHNIFCRHSYWTMLGNNVEDFLFMFWYVLYSHRIIDDRMENSIRGRRIVHNLHSYIGWLQDFVFIISRNYENENFAATLLLHNLLSATHPPLSSARRFFNAARQCYFEMKTNTEPYFSILSSIILWHTQYTTYLYKKIRYLLPCLPLILLNSKFTLFYIITFKFNIICYECVIVQYIKSMDKNLNFFVKKYTYVTSCKMTFKLFYKQQLPAILWGWGKVR